MGRKIGFKRSDRRFLSDDGQEWDSKFEWLVYSGLKGAGHRVRRCDQSDSISYNTAVKQGKCLECGGTVCVQERIYTPDLYVGEPSGKGTSANRGFTLECKGFFPADKRSLFRAVANQATGIDLRIVFEREVKLKGTVGTNVDYIKKYLKGFPVGTWNRETQEIDWK